MKKCLDDDDASLISDPLFQRLFRLFLLFAEPLDSAKAPASPTDLNLPTKNRSLQYITAAQSHFIVNELFRLARPRCAAPLPIPQQSDQVTFRELVELCDLVFPDRKQLEPVVDRVFDRYVSQIVNKGFLMCRKAPSKVSCAFRKTSKPWKSYWCTVVPGTIFLWPLHKKTNVANRIAIVLDSSAVVHMGTFDEDRFTWQLYTSKHKYQFGHFDEIQRQHWMADMSLVCEYRNKTDLFNFDREFSKRVENLGKEKDYSWKVALESENQRLTNLLNEERRALYDEEIVRELATRMLDEERERSEQLEKQVEDLQTLLHDEKALVAQMRQRLKSETVQIEEIEDLGSQFASDQLTMGSSSLASEADTEEYEICADHPATPLISEPNIDYLIVSTQSI